jgi:hypothetical protein
VRAEYEQYAIDLREREEREQREAEAQEKRGEPDLKMTPSTGGGVGRGHGRTREAPRGRAENKPSNVVWLGHRGCRVVRDCFSSKDFIWSSVKNVSEGDF